MNTNSHFAPSALSRNQGIDLLRGLAVLLVVMHHTGLRFALKKTMLASVFPKRLLDSVIYNGYEAVFVFFVISGFLITSNCLVRWQSLDRINLREFYTRRVARIMPCLLLLVVILSLLHGLSLPDYTIDTHRESLSGAIGSALFLHLNWYEGHHGYLPGSWDVLWSLSIEEAFYIGFPLLCLLLPRRGYLVALLIIVAVSLPFTHAALVDNEIWQEKAYLPGMSAIAIGVLAALMAQYAKPASDKSTLVAVRGLLLAGTAGLAGIIFIEDLIWPLLQDTTLLLLSLSTACLVVGCHWLNGIKTINIVVGARWLTKMGRLSYEIYLMHMFVVFAAVELFSLLQLDMRYGFICYVPVMAGSCLLGFCLERLFSTPADRYLRRVISASPGKTDESPELAEVEN